MPDANYTADAVVLSELLSTASSPIEVPDWQRSYSWKSDQVEVFWADLMRFNNTYPGATIANQQYFLGSIVMVNTPPKYLLLDGQQRLATATILLSALREHRRPLDGQAALRLQTKYIADYDDGSKQTQYSLAMNRYDRDFFRRLIQAEGEPIVAPKMRSHSLVKRAQEYFKAQIAAIADGKSAEEALALNIRLQDVLLKHFSVVSVRSNDEDTASTVFEALNDRGIGLSTPDLLRSFLLRSAPGVPERERIVAAWLAIFSLFEEASVEPFLRHYWVSLNGDVKTRSLYREIKSHFSEHGVDAVVFSEELAEAASDYQALKDASDADEVVKKSLEGINQLAATVLYPALMSALSVRNEVTPAEFQQFARNLLILFVRHSLIGGKESTKLEAEIFSLAQDIRVRNSLVGANARISSFAPTLADFARAFEVATVTRADSAKYILAELEMDLRSTDELVLASGRKVQLEHIYPQNPLADERLTSHVALVNRIGNHTLLDHRLNSSIKNGIFKTKKADAYSRSELHLTSALISVASERWGQDEIISRQVALAKQAARVWKFDDREYETFVEEATADASSVTTADLIEDLPEDDETAIEA